MPPSRKSRLYLKTAHGNCRAIRKAKAQHAAGKHDACCNVHVVRWFNHNAPFGRSPIRQLGPLPFVSVAVVTGDASHIQLTRDQTERPFEIALASLTEA
jgi:hypothetical protein